MSVSVVKSILTEFVMKTVKLRCVCYQSHLSLALLQDTLMFTTFQREIL